MLVTPLKAEKVSIEKAKSVAQSHTRRVRGLQAGKNLKLIETKSRKAKSGLRSSNEEGDPMYYVFSEGDNQGFVIVSGNDIATPVLGYSNSGTAGEGNENFEYWMDCLSQQIEYAIENNIPQSKEIKTQWENYLSGNTNSLRAATAVGPLLATQWNQFSPYNDLCPNQYPSGCVATAITQIMKYYNYPASRTVSLPGYGIPLALGGGYVPEIVGTTTYEWSLMENTYSSYASSSSYGSSASRAAVATLMYEFGVSAKMYYTGSGSGASTMQAATSLIQYFNYDQSMQFEDRYYYFDDEWATLLRNKLNESCPIFYNGSGNKINHAFVCDGYDDSGKFHFNWGWGGLYDGYFVINPLTLSTYQFNGFQQIITDIKPNAGGVPNPDIKIAPQTDISTPKTSLNKGVSFIVTTYFTGTTIIGFNGNSGAVLTDANGNILYFIGEGQYGLDGIRGGDRMMANIICKIPSTIMAGNYKLRAVYRAAGTSEWLIARGSPGYADFLDIKVNPLTDATLKSLTINSGSLIPAFNPSTLSYTVNVAKSVTSITLAGTANDPNATVSGNGTKSLAGGDNTFKITVTAEDGITKNEYTITVNRAASPDATLKSLTTNMGTLSPGFNASTTGYTINLSSYSDSITLTGTANYASASVSGAGTLFLDALSNVFSITVTAEDGITKKTYKVTVNRPASSDTGLGAVSTLSNPVIDLKIGTQTTLKNNAQCRIVVPYAVTSIDLEGKGVYRNSEVISGQGVKNLQVGDNPFTLTVRAEDKTTSQAHQVIVSRMAADSVSPGSIYYKVSVLSDYSIVNLTGADNDYPYITAAGAIAGKIVQLNQRRLFKEIATEEKNAMRTYTVTIDRAPSPDASLKSLTINSDLMNQEFGAETSYTASVPYSVGEVTITGIPNHPYATVSGNNIYPLSVGNNSFRLTVTAEDGITTKDYTVTINRPSFAGTSNDAKLDLLSTLSNPIGCIKLETETNLADTATSCNIVVPNAVSSITLGGITRNPITRIEGAGLKTLNAGDNVFTLTVTAEDGTTKKDYTIMINRLLIDSVSNNLVRYKVGVPSLQSIVSLWGDTDNYPYFTASGIVNGVNDLNIMIGYCQILREITTQDNNIMRTYTIALPMNLPIQFAPENLTSVEQPKEKISIYGADKAIQAIATTNIRNIRIYSLTGTLIYSNPSVNTQEYRVAGISAGIYLVKVIYGGNQVQITKVMVR